MAGPYNYDVDMPDPTQGFLKGVQLLQGLRQQEAAQEQVKKRNEIMGNLIALGSNATAEDIYQASLQLPDDASSLRTAWDQLGKDRKDALFRGGSEAYLLAKNGDLDGAKETLTKWADGFENSGDNENAQKMRAAARMMELHPETATQTIGMTLALADGERFKNVAQPTEATTFQKDFQFIKDTFGEEAAADYAQYGRDSVVSIPLGEGKTYVGPASMAPGASRWVAKDRAPEGVPQILERAKGRKQITSTETQAIKKSLGPNGTKQFEAWLQDNGIREIVRSGTDANGRRVVQYADGSVEYAD